MALTKPLYALTNPAIKAWWRLRRSMTLGVRVIGVDEDGRIALVRHTYVEGWHLPGGGVERGETAHSSAVREFEEETGAPCLSQPELIGAYTNFRQFRGDHVLLYRVAARETDERLPDREIEAVVWASVDELPADATAATRRRVNEVFFAEPASADW